MKPSNLVAASNDNFASCSCDLTQGACDAQCCCDTECAKSTIEIWKKAGSCSTEIQTIETLKKCTDKINAIQVDDIQDGLRYFTKFGSSLMCSAKEGTVSDTNTFIENNYPQINSTSDFDKLLETGNTWHKIDNQHSSKSYDSEVAQPSKSVEASLGYQPFEQVKGFLK